MKKTLIALAAVAVSSAAMAQATVSGLVGYAYQKAPNEKHSGMALTDATIAASASEDLGGGMRATAGITFDGASAQFGQALNRRNTSIGLAGGFGSISLANTRSSDLLARGFVAPSNLAEGLYNRSLVVSRTQIDVATLTLPAMSGFTPYIQYVETGTTTAQADGGLDASITSTVVGANYAAGPIAAGVAYKSNDGDGIPAGAKKTNVEFFATYNMGVARVGFGYDSAVQSGGDAGMSAGIAIPMGALTAGVNYAARGDNKVTEVAFKYDLSKRTALNASFGEMTADEATAGKGNQYRVGIAHAF